jgi:antirestriction protein ArdC
MANFIYDKVAQKIINGLKEKKSFGSFFHPSTAMSVYGYPYSGINEMLLTYSRMENGYKYNTWGTLKAIRAKGGWIDDLTQKEMVVYFKMSIMEDEFGEEVRRIPFIRYYFVYNLDQVKFETAEGKAWLGKIGYVEKAFERRHKAEQIKDNYLDNGGPEFTEQASPFSYYNPAKDMVVVQPHETFVSPEYYYNIVFHELAHSTGHKKRLNRFELTQSLGEHAYSKEELVAEFASAYLSTISGFEDTKRSAGYIGGWASVLQDNSKWVVWAAARAREAANMILGISEKQPSEVVNNSFALV